MFCPRCHALERARSHGAFGGRNRVGVSVCVFNPIVSGEPLRGNILLNSLLLTYLVPAGLLWLIARGLAPFDLDRLRPL